MADLLNRIRQAISVFHTHHTSSDFLIQVLPLVDTMAQSQVAATRGFSAGFDRVWADPPTPSAT
jgi:hypothetical protein